MYQRYTVETALEELNSHKEWPALKRSCQRLRQEAAHLLSPLHLMRCRTWREVEATHHWPRFCTIACMLTAVGIYAVFSIFRSRNRPRGIPNGLKPAFSTGDDCLYISVSIALTGDEDQRLV